MVMKQKTMAWLSEIYNLILHPGTRQWEREQLVQAKNTLETQLATKQKAGKHEKESSNSLEDQQTKRVLEKLEASQSFIKQSASQHRKRQGMKKQAKSNQ